MEAGLRVHDGGSDGGSGEPVLLLLHGLGATGHVWEGWRPLLARRWPGRWLAPDLPGHGGSRPHGQWQLVMDPGAFAIGAPDMAQLLARAQARVTLARGEHDAMNTDEQLFRLGVPTVTLPGLGHNAHVQSPQLSIALLDPHR
jgi:pimeloyl-ACP methyl ester carboxylesterase